MALACLQIDPDCLSHTLQLVKRKGLGLAIVKKIIEEHGGVLKLEDAIPFENSNLIGALVSFDLLNQKKL